MSIVQQLRQTYPDTEARLLGDAPERPAELLEIRGHLRASIYHLDHAADRLDRAGTALDRAWDRYKTTDTDERARETLANLQEQADEIRRRLQAMID